MAGIQTTYHIILDSVDGNPSSGKKMLRCSIHLICFFSLSGALCGECNMKIDPVRPEADIYFHNLTGFDGNDEN